MNKNNRMKWLNSVLRVRHDHWSNGWEIMPRWEKMSPLAFQVMANEFMRAQGLEVEYYDHDESLEFRKVWNYERGLK